MDDFCVSVPDLSSDFKVGPPKYNRSISDNAGDVSHDTISNNIGKYKKKVKLHKENFNDKNFEIH